MSDEADASPSEEFLKAIARAPAVEPPMPDTDLVGQTMGRFRVLSRLGQGGMGIVYRAKDSVLGREVALKVLPQEVMRDPSRRRRFLKEARLAAAITHNNLVAIYDVGDTEERIYLAMELVDGEPLRAKLSSGPMDVGEVLRIGADIARGIARAHAAGIVHRDLKPENVMVASDGTVKILDFGIATIRTGGVEGTTPTETGGSEGDLGIVVGTPSYMSPEQAKLQEITDKSDCFALGVVLYEMLTGRRPFTGASAFAIVTAIDRDTPERPDVARLGVPRSLADLVMQCLAKAPQARPTAEAIARALGDIELRPDSTARPPSARPSIRAYVGAAGLLGLGVVVVLALAGNPAPSAKGPVAPTAEAEAEPSFGVGAPDASSAPATPPTASVAASVAAPASPSVSTSTSAPVSAARASRGKAPASSAAPPSSPAERAAPSAPPTATTERDPLADPI